MDVRLSVLKRCIPKTLAFAFGLRLRSKTRCFKTRVLGRRLPIGKPQERLRFRALRSKTQCVQKNAFFCIIFLRFKDLPRGRGLRLGPLCSKNTAFCVCVLKPTKTFVLQGPRFSPLSAAQGKKPRNKKKEKHRRLEAPPTVCREALKDHF